MTLAELGWNGHFAAEYALLAAKDLRPGRVAIEFNQNFRIYLEGEELDAVTAGRVKHRAKNRAELPAVGDGVVVRQREAHGAVIVAVATRASAFTRRGAGNVTGERWSPRMSRRLRRDGARRRFQPASPERYLVDGARKRSSPVFSGPSLISARVPAILMRPLGGRRPSGARAQPKLGEGIEPLRAHLGPGLTAALLGSSGVGKSTIINRLVGSDVQRTREVRESDSRGRHTTTHRELVMLPEGGLIIDTPGMRELQLWDAAGAVRETFEEIEVLAAGCHFSNCRHRDEPRCAVKRPLRRPCVRRASGSYLKLQIELTGLAKRRTSAKSTTKNDAVSHGVGSISSAGLCRQSGPARERSQFNRFWTEGKSG